MLHYARTDCLVVSLEQLRSPQQPLVWRAPPAVCWGHIVSLNSGLAAAGWSNIFIWLCNLHPGPMKCGKTTDLRWLLILRDYHRIKQIVTSNTLLMQETDNQLAEVNQNTLIQWHDQRQTRLELYVRTQGSVLPPVVHVQPLKEAKVLPDEPMQAQEKHKYQLPKCTAGQGQQRQRPSSTHLPHLIMPKGPTKRTYKNIYLYICICRFSVCVYYNTRNITKKLNSWAAIVTKCFYWQHVQNTTTATIIENKSYYLVIVVGMELCRFRATATQRCGGRDMQYEPEDVTNFRFRIFVQSLQAYRPEVLYESYAGNITAAWTQTR